MTNTGGSQHQHMSGHVHNITITNFDFA